MLIFLDLQTTGNEGEEKLCSVACIVFEKGKFIRTFHELFNEGKKISAQASARHNITNEMIAKKSSFSQSKLYRFLQQQSKREVTLVVHNMAFVLDKLALSGCKWQQKVIDTQRVVKHRILECELFTLEFLRYELKLYRKENRLKSVCGIKDALIAHHALSNAVVIKLLFEYLKVETSIEAMYDLTFSSVLLEKFPFGKYAGRYIEDIVMNERSYILWMLSLEELDADLRYSIEYYFKG